ncbi:hypothetical protein [Sciscionella marina]|uniref:hypothetical protein n=1 Tax=Sciscionella marina TaxID=508770 RepID=UPI0012F65050|nr:hypothetical protein [Sciscionella marina]
MSQHTYKIGELVELLMSGRVDVLECQRVFQRHAGWVAQLIESTIEDCPWGSLLFWVPDQQNRPQGGRYLQATDAEYFLIDGNQRSTALVASIGQRPPYIPEDEWSAMNGPNLAVSVGITHHGGVRFRPTSWNVQGDIPLGALLAGAPIEDLLERAGIEQRKGLVQQLADTASQINNFEVRVEWITGTEEQAERCFLRRNEKVTHTALKSEQFHISLLTSRFRPLQRDFVNPLLRQATVRNMGKVVNPRSVNRLYQHFLPSELRGARARNTDAQLVEEITLQVVESVTRSLDYLERLGIVHQDLLPFPSMIDVFAAMLARYPAESMTDQFLGHWLTHMIAGEVFGGARGVHRELKALERSTSYKQAVLALSEFAPVGRPSPYTAERVMPMANGRFGSPACLHALASASKTVGLVADLRDNGVTFPSREMTLHNLVINPVKGYLPHYALMTPGTAATIQRGHGWTRQAYEELRPTPQVLDAHQLAPPEPSLDERHARDRLDEYRPGLLAQTIDTYLRTIPPLPGREGIEQGNLF